MHNNENIVINKAFILKLILFLIVITLIIVSYFENKSIIDIFSLIIVIVLFVKFLIVKLYH